MRSPGSRALEVASGVFYSLAAVVLLVVVALCLPLGGARPLAVMVQSALGVIVPAPILGVLVVATPLGGAFRGDYVIFAALLAIVGVALSHLSRNVGR